VSSPEDDAWRQIVDHYGDAPEFPEEPAAELDLPVDVPVEEAPLEPEDADALGAFVPPDPPPVPRPHGPRLAAWLGLFGAPILLIVSAIASFRLSSFISTLLVVWFLSGFGYLVWQMPNERDDPDDDGARL
jgi:hypothetical protein